MNNLLEMLEKESIQFLVWHAARNWILSDEEDALFSWKEWENISDSIAMMTRNAHDEPLERNEG